ncbi:N-terminal acetyltransferase A, auxiliary subunit [Gonapodya prolifera JEL478]|uniref:N-terminal acetyltransferase A, auxiliary subunit n=1 Tax=Gonapodya prolifera (strain JEL478) TaxID=1344416 RepID=A0A139AAH6_GONPJ|nr:N-terminal acetyltransferase A, auxiliary subunit [Gonapodya prolifera JEL478]|eukprot:KXS13811.1 N-terminal acetyltransferase A, auxiliary subunit [Gonapodya prolifera JEL478]
MSVVTASGKPGSAQKPVNALPSKEGALFKGALKFFEFKQYKKGLKAVDQILKKVPDHGETLALKGLFLANLDKKEEGFELVKKGLAKDLRSQTSWHIYGLLHRAEKNYEEAMKCYANALRIEKQDNMQILRDLALLQAHIRNFEGFSETQTHLLTLKPANRQFWLSLAAAYHLLQNYELAERVVTSYVDTLKSGPEATPEFELSEMLMYRNMIIEESGDLERALKDLDGIKAKVVDKLAWSEAKARILFKATRLDDAADVYTELLSINPEAKAYWEGLESSKGLQADSSDEQRAQLVELYQSFSAKLPRGHLVKLIPLTYAPVSDSFRSELDRYLTIAFRKGVPSVFVSLRPLYAAKRTVSEDDPSRAKEKIIQELVEGYRTNLKKSNKFSAEEQAEQLPDPSTALLWVNYFLALHYDHLRNLTKALEHIDEAIASSPTIVELTMTKARIYKHAGSYETASKTMSEARSLDLQDRFINSKAAKYFLRNDEVAEAAKTVGLFTKPDTDPVQDLIEMQCLWFATESAKSWIRQNKPGQALKRFHQIEKHFTEFYDDQFDFHGYSARKTTVRTYVEMLRWEDKLRNHKYFFDAAVVAVELYLSLHEHPELKKALPETNGIGELSEADKKKAAKKARKQELKAAEEKVEQKKGKNDDKKKVIDDDPDGEKLVNAPDLLLEATKFVKSLQELSPNRIESQALAAHVYIRRKKYILALRSIRKGLEIDPQDPSLLRATIRFSKDFQTDRETLNPVARELLLEEVESVLGSNWGNSSARIASFLGNNSDSIPHVFAGAQALVSVDPASKADAIAKILSVLERQGARSSFETVASVYDALRSPLRTDVDLTDSAAAQRVLEMGKGWFPLSGLFGGDN